MSGFAKSSGALLAFQRPPLLVELGRDTHQNDGLCKVDALPLEIAGIAAPLVVGDGARDVGVEALESQGAQHVEVVADGRVALAEAVDPVVVDPPRVGLLQSDAVAAAGREQGEAHGVEGRAHVDDYVVVVAPHHAPHLAEVAPERVPLALGEGNDMVDGGMAAEERLYLLVEHEGDVGLL